MRGYPSTVGVSSLRGFQSIEAVSLRDYPSVVTLYVQQRWVACVICGHPFIAAVRSRMQGYPSTVGEGSLRGCPSIEGVSLRD